MLSVASIRQQFSCPENILMSLYSVQFLRNIHQYLSVENEESLDVGLAERGYLFLTSEAGETVMRENYALQRYFYYSLSFSVSITLSSLLILVLLFFCWREHGCCVELLGPLQLAQKFPWISTEGIALASFGE